MNNTERAVNTMELFGHTYMNSNALYMQVFGKMPCITMINSVDGEKACGLFKQKYGGLIKQEFSYRQYSAGKTTANFDITQLVLENDCVIEFDEGYCEILHDSNAGEFVQGLIASFTPMKRRQRRQPLEINLVVTNNRYLELKPMEIKRTKLDLDLFYEDDFRQTDEIIRKRLNSKKDKGIVLLHGLPGTGKTTYLRYLVGKIKKRVLFLSPNIACNLVEPEFIQLLINNPDSVLIIEDAENVIMDRKVNANSSVSGLLNISDGLLADFLNVQLVCTFNNALTLIDNALMRKGRLIARYEFGKLNADKAQRLSKHLGFETTINKPMTVAEIANQREADQQVKQMEAIGFKREYLNN